jgi:Tol biopolymer transport system component
MKKSKHTFLGRRLALLCAAASVAGAVLAMPAQASFPGGNGRILVTREAPRGTDNTTIQSVNVRTGRAKQLTKVPRRCRGKRDDWEDLEASYSSNGDRIVYEHSDNCDRRLRTGIYVMKANGKGRRLLIADKRGWDLYWPAFSPDGTQVVFERDWTRGDPEFEGSYYSTTYTIPANGAGKPVRLDRIALSYDAYPAWSATNRIAVTGVNDSLDGLPLIFFSSISVIEPPLPGDGDPSRGRLTAARSYDSAPDWSPDGKQLVFARGADAEDSHADVWLTAADGGLARRLTRNRHAWAPVWSPDGRQIAYVLERKKKPNVLYVMRADGTHRHRVRSLVDSDRLSWQPRPAR